MGVAGTACRIGRRHQGRHLKDAVTAELKLNVGFANVPALTVGQRS